jgi:hypothetical protein
MRTCKIDGCNEPVETGHRGKSLYCKLHTCRNRKEYNQRYYEEHDKKKHKRKTRTFETKEDYNRTRNAQRRQILRDLLTPCIICGESDKSKLIRHHINPDDKLDTISALADKKVERIEKELNKCNVICRSCHMSIHNKMRVGKEVEEIL